MFATTFSFTQKGYQLIVDSSVAIATTAWLESNGCQFDRYVSQGVTRYVFFIISDAVIDRIAAKHGCTGRPVALATLVLVEPITVVSAPTSPIRMSAKDAIAQALKESNPNYGDAKLTRNVYLKLLRGTEEDAQQWIDNTFSGRANKARRIQYQSTLAA